MVGVRIKWVKVYNVRSAWPKLPAQKVLATVFIIVVVTMVIN